MAWRHVWFRWSFGVSHMLLTTLTQGLILSLVVAALKSMGQCPTLGSATYVYSIVFFCSIVFLFRQRSVCCCIDLLLHLIDWLLVLSRPLQRPGVTVPWCGDVMLNATQDPPGRGSQPIGCHATELSHRWSLGTLFDFMMLSKGSHLTQSNVNVQIASPL